jgi:hypothetical protein
MSGRGLVAWIEPQGSHYVAAYVSAKTRWLRDPATRLFSAAQEARRWVGARGSRVGRRSHPTVSLPRPHNTLAAQSEQQAYGWFSQTERAPSSWAIGYVGREVAASRRSRPSLGCWKP